MTPFLKGVCYLFQGPSFWDPPAVCFREFTLQYGTFWGNDWIPFPMVGKCWLPGVYLAKFNIALEKLPKPNRKVVFQPQFLRGELLNFGGVSISSSTIYVGWLEQKVVGKKALHFCRSRWSHVTYHFQKEYKETAAVFQFLLFRVPCPFQPEVPNLPINKEGMIQKPALWDTCDVFLMKTMGPKKTN